jgi:predicted DsbA family dithiol-disulfide isomerase
VRLDSLRRELPDLVSIEWRSFLLRPSVEQRSLEEFTRYTERWARPAASEPATTFRTWSGEHQPPSHSMPSAIAGKAVRHVFGDDAFDRFHLALMHAYFAENRTISDGSVIADVARACGLDAGRLNDRLASGRDDLTAEVIDDHKAALADGIAAVPTAVINGEYMLQGAMTLDQYRKVVERLAG